MLVPEFIELLKKQPQDLHVVYPSCSEQALVEEADITVIEACEARPDGWVHDKRPDKPVVKYLIIGG